MKANVLYLDVETINQPYTTGHKLGHKAWLQIDYAAIVSVSYAWGEDGKVQNINAGMWPKEYKKDPFNDKKLMGELAKVILQADFLVGHNMREFDKRVIQTRLILNGYNEAAAHISNVKVLDTLVEARKVLAVKSKRLGALCELLNLPNKLGSDMSFWTGVMRSDPAAIKKMAKYNDGDIVSLQAVYKALRPFFAKHPNFHFESKEACPACGSTWIVIGARPLLNGKHAYERRHCRKCGQDSRGAKL